MFVLTLAEALGVWSLAIGPEFTAGNVSSFNGEDNKSGASAKVLGKSFSIRRCDCDFHVVPLGPDPIPEAMLAALTWPISPPWR
jgi:hypothetical protein